MPDFVRLLNAIDAAESQAYGADADGELPKQRSRAIEYFLGKNLEPAPEGRSQVVDRSVFETVQWIMPSFISIFANGDDVVGLPPVGPEDEEGAKQEAQYLNHILLNKNPWLEICLTWFTDACLTKNAYAYPYRDRKRRVSIERYERQTSEQLALLLQDKDVEVLEQSEQDSGEMEPVVGPDGPQMVVAGVDPNGQPIMQPAMQPKMLYDLKIRRVEERNHFCVDILPPERCKISERTPSFRLEKCSYFEYDEIKTISELREEGFDVPDDIASDEDLDEEEDDARDQFSERNSEDDAREDPAMRRVKVRCVWIRHDYDEDGIAEMQYCVVVGQEILYREEVGRIPIACIVPIPLPHRHIGMSVADMVADIQRIKTAILRGGLDNLYHSNNSQKAISNKVNLDDALISRPNQPIRVDTDMPDVQGHIVPIVTPFIFPQAMEGLEYMDQVKENRTGTNRYFTGIDQNALNKTARGIQQLTTMAAQRVTLIARIFASGIEDLCSILHEEVLKSGHSQEVVKLRNKWVAIDPAQWKKRTDFKASVGYAAGNKDAMVSRLMMILDAQKAFLPLGIAQPKNIHNALVELTKASDFANPEAFWSEPPAQPAPPQPDVTVMAAEQLRSQTAVQSEQIKAQTDRYESDQRAAVDKYKTDVDANVKLTLAGQQAEQADRLEDKRLNGSRQLEETKAQLNPKFREAVTKEQEASTSQQILETFVQSQQQQTQAIMQMIERLAQTLSAPRRVVRDKAGKVSGTELVQ